jgi:hypothetical protein
MIKSAFAALAAAPLFAGAAMAGPYVNVEANSGFTGSDYSGTTTDLHVGYEGATGALGYYVQGGPSVVSPLMVLLVTPFSLVRLAVLLLLPRTWVSMVNLHSLLVLMVPTMVTAPRLV